MTLEGERVARAVIYLRVSSAAQVNTDYDRDGFSLPAQREACHRKAESLGAEVVEEFVERGVSAKTTAKRSALARMLQDLRDDPVDFVIVHKLDRLARNRADDVEIVAAIQATGARLVSVSENIDETPSGSLLHGIMSSIAEFYSKNLAAEVMKGTTEKAKRGGTPFRAPIGYLNHREWVDNGDGTSREVRTIALDPDRAPQLRLAFRLYATGDYSLSELAAILEARGLRSRATAKAASKALGTNRLQQLLRNDYYVGIVRYNGKVYEGRHEHLVPRAVFDTVQFVLDSQRTSGERSWRHHHYLSRILSCAACGRRLIYTRNTGNGGTYEYFVCSGRQGGHCSQPHHRAKQIEESVAECYDRILLSDSEREVARVRLRELAEGRAELGVRDIAAAKREVGSLLAAETKLFTAHLADQVSPELFDQESKRILRERAAAEATIRNFETEVKVIVEHGDAAIALTDRTNVAYRRADGPVRRLFNQALFLTIGIDAEEVVEAEMAPPFDQVHRLAGRAKTAETPPSDLTRALLAAKPREAETTAPGRDGGSNFVLMVGDEGLEPPTPCV